MTAKFEGALNLSEPDRLICRVLRGEKFPWPHQEDRGLEQAFLSRSQYYGVQALLHEQLANARDWPREILETIRRNTIRDAMWELRHRLVIETVLESLAEIGVQPVLFKGTALAYSLYASPALRTRGDTDLIIPAESRSDVEAALVRLGLTRDFSISGEYISYQASYVSRPKSGGTHGLDLHWKISNSELLSRLFSYDELRESATPLPALSARALATDLPHALLIACMHRGLHRQVPYYIDGVAHLGGNRLIWIYDIHLLACAMSELQWKTFLKLAVQKSLCAPCLKCLEDSKLCFRTSVPEYVRRALGQSTSRDALGCYFDAGQMKRQWLDFRAIGTASCRIGFLRELLFPPPDYMRHKYNQASFRWLPWLYVRRVCAGFAKVVG